MPLSVLDFQYVQDLLLDKAGVIVDSEQQPAVEARIKECAKAFGFDSDQVFVEHLRSSHYSRLHRQLVEALVDQTTSFFRDFPVFKFIKNEAIPKITEHHRSDKTIRIWSGACSSGQEVYSLAIMFNESVSQVGGWDVRIVGSDMSKSLLDKAAIGIYTQAEIMRGVPAPVLLKNFTQDVNKYEVKEQHRNLVEFRQINLCSDWNTLPGKWDYEPVFDIVLLRNVLPYFSEERRKSLLTKVPFHMHEGSYLILGKGEQLPDGVLGFDLCDEKLGVYRRNDVVVPHLDADALGAPSSQDEGQAPKGEAPSPSPEVPAPAAAPVAASAATAPSEQGPVLVTCKFEALQNVIDMVLRDLDPQSHIYIGVKKEPPPEGALFQVVDTIPDWAKKK